MKKKLLIGVCIMTLFLTSGCGKIPELENGQQAVVTLNDKSFSVDELYNELKKQYGTSILINMVDKYIVDKEIETTDEVTKYVNEQFEQAKTYYESSYKIDFADILLQNGFNSEQEYKDYLQTGYKQQLLVKKYLNEHLTEDEINQFYESDVYGKITAKHILIEPEVTSSMSADEKKKAEEAALNKAKELIEKIKNGEDFDTLAKEHSADTASATNGGLLDPFDNTSGLVTEFFEAASKLNNGEYTTEPVKSEFGYHIIYRISSEEKPSLESVKEDVKKRIVEKKLSDDSDNTLSKKTLVTIRKEYGLNIIDTDLSKIYSNSIKSYE